MKRGDVVTVAAGSGFGGKPRPAVVIQDDMYLDISTVVLALVSSDERAARLSVSVSIEPNQVNGLERFSYVMAHEIVSVRTEKVDKFLGVLSATDMQRVDRALILFLGLRG